MTTHKRDGDDVLRYMSWAATQEDWRPPELPMGEEMQDAVIGEIAAGDKEAGKDVPGTVSDELDLESKRPKLEKVPKKGEPSFDPDLTTKSTPTEPDASDAKTGITEPAQDAASNNAMSKLARRNKFRMEREQERLRKRRATYDALAQARKMYFEGEFETCVRPFSPLSFLLKTDKTWILDRRLLIACPYEPWSIVEKVLPYLAGSAQIVIYSPYLQVRRNLFTQKLKTYESLLISSFADPIRSSAKIPPIAVVRELFDLRTHAEEVPSPPGTDASRDAGYAKRRVPASRDEGL